jgi:L-aspartate oxidase
VKDEPVTVSPAGTGRPPRDILARKGDAPETMILEHDWDSVRRVMWDYVGIVRDRVRLDVALSRLRTIRATVEDTFAKRVVVPELVELRNIALLGELIVLCARARRESRGLHFDLDHPGKADGPAADTVIARDVPAAGETAWAAPETEGGRG